MAVALSTSDPNSYSEPEKCIIKSLDWNVSIDFEAHIIRGFSDLKIEKKDSSAKSLILDVRDLKIEQITHKESNDKLPFDISNPANVSFGSKLTINIETIKSDSFTVKIKYETSSSCSALQWMKPEQTAGKRQPYLFSQCQAIHARSLVPCQDTPRVKFPYTATVRAPSALTVLMSAKRLGAEPVPGDTDQVETRFEMAVPIPAYLVALVAGDLVSKDIGPRSKVWTEKELLDASAYEFAETEDMLATAEKLMGPYVWGHYDLLVLPPSFPYGGMENPCLTFVTPTLLAGDRSLADVIAHEISHSWTGNLVTNATFESFWINEGHTRFVECKIVAALCGNPLMFDYKVHDSFRKLKDTVQTLTSGGEEPYTKLVPDLRGVDPDDAFSSVPYEKGFALLYMLEGLLGGPEVFEPFLRAYIENFKYQSITTQQWKDFLFQHFSSPSDQTKLNSVDWETWFYGTGLPPFTPKYDLSIAQPVLDLSARWLKVSDGDLGGFSGKDLEGTASLLVREFLSTLVSSQKPVMSLTKVHKMEEVYKFNSVNNSEVKFLWLRLCVKVQWKDQLDRCLAFVNEQGRMKFVRPIYRELYSWESVRQAAIANFEQHRSEMHSTTAMLLAKDLHLAH